MSENPLITDSDSEGPSSINGGGGQGAEAEAVATPYEIHGKALPATLVAILLVIVIMLAIHFKWVRWQQRQIRWLRNRPLSPSPTPSLPRLHFIVNFIPHTTTATSAAPQTSLASTSSFGLDKAALDKALPATPCDLSKDSSSANPSSGGGSSAAGGGGAGILVLLQCMVCLEKFGDGELVRALPDCHHRFHADCIDRWFRAHSDCPLCRATIRLGGGGGGGVVSGREEGQSSEAEGRSAASIPTQRQPETLIPTRNPGHDDPIPLENLPPDAVLGVPILPKVYYITK